MSSGCVLAACPRWRFVAFTSIHSPLIVLRLCLCFVRCFLQDLGPDGPTYVPELEKDEDREEIVAASVQSLDFVDLASASTRAVALHAGGPLSKDGRLGFAVVAPDKLSKLQNKRAINPEEATSQASSDGGSDTATGDGGPNFGELFTKLYEKLRTANRTVNIVANILKSSNAMQVSAWIGGSSLVRSANWCGRVIVFVIAAAQEHNFINLEAVYPDGVMDEDVDEDDDRDDQGDYLAQGPYSEDEVEDAATKKKRLKRQATAEERERTFRLRMFERQRLFEDQATFLENKAVHLTTVLAAQSVFVDELITLRKRWKLCTGRVRSCPSPNRRIRVLRHQSPQFTRLTPLSCVC